VILALESVGHKIIKIDENEVFKYNLFIKIFRRIERVIEKIMLPENVDGHFVRMWGPTVKIKNVIDQYLPDIVQVGFSGGNILSFKEIAEIDMPIVFRMSDLWPFSGYSHYPTQVELNYIDKIKRYICVRIFNHNYKNDVVSCLRKSNIYIAFPSLWLKNSIAGKMSRVNNLSVIRNSYMYSLSESNKIEKQDKHATDKNIVLVVVASKLDDYRKGVWGLKRYLNDLVKGIPIKYLLIGNYSVKMKREFDRCSDGVVFYGPLNNKDVINVISSANYLLCPSIYDNSPNVILEAYSVMVPVIVQCGGGAAEYVKDGYNGLFFDFLNSLPGDLSKLIVSEKSKGIKKENCYQTLLDDYSLKKIGDDYTKLYEKALVSYQR